MKPTRLYLMYLQLAVFVAAVVLAAPGARAFTVDTKSMNNSDGSPKFTDPDEQIERFGRGSMTTQQGNGTFGFEVRPSYGAVQRGWFNPIPDTGALRDNR
jgi:hypothetical protein